MVDGLNGGSILVSRNRVGKLLELSIVNLFKNDIDIGINLSSIGLITKVSEFLGVTSDSTFKFLLCALSSLLGLLVRLTSNLGMLLFFNLLLLSLFLSFGSFTGTGLTVPLLCSRFFFSASLKSWIRGSRDKAKSTSLRNLAVSSVLSF